MNDKQRIKRLESTLSKLISWLFTRPLSDHEVKSLLDMMAGPPPEEPETEGPPGNIVKWDYRQKNANDLEMSTRTSNALQWAGIKTVAKLVEFNRRELRKIPNLGPKSLKEIENELAERDLWLKA